MTRNLTVLRKPLRRSVELAGVVFIVGLHPDGRITLRAKHHSETHERHLASVFPDLIRHHGLLTGSGLELFGRREPAVRPFDGRSR